MHILFAAYVCDRWAGSEAGNAFQVVSHVAANRDSYVTVLTRDGNAERLRSQFLAAGVAADVVGVDDEPQFLGLAGRTVGVYERYRSWISRGRDTVSTMEYDIGHHLTWGSLYLGSPLSAHPDKLIFGPVGGGPPYWPGVVAWLPLREQVTEILRAAVARSASVVDKERTAKRAHLVLCANRVTESEGRRLGARDTLRVLPEAVGSAELAVAFDRESDMRFVWLGRFLPRKAPMLAVKAFEKALDEGVEATLEMVGDGPMLEDVRRYVERRDLAESVLLRGRVRHEEVFDLLDRCRAHIFSSVRDTSGAQVLEAAARGVPSIMCSWQPMTEWVPVDARFTAGKALLKSGQVASLASVVVEVAMMEEQRHRVFSQSAHSWARAQTWADQGRRLSEVYRWLAV